jgi:hypothetical protein
MRGQTGRSPVFRPSQICLVPVNWGTSRLSPSYPCPRVIPPSYPGRKTFVYRRLRCSVRRRERAGLAGPRSGQATIHAALKAPLFHGKSQQNELTGSGAVLKRGSYEGTDPRGCGKTRFPDEKRSFIEDYDAAYAAVKERALQARVPGKARFTRR